MKWLPILRTEDSHVYVKTDRGIEAARKQYQFCDEATPGDYALCKSVKGELVMENYSEEVNV